MRTLSALFGLSLIIVAIGIGWWSPVERAPLSREIASSQVEPAPNVLSPAIARPATSNGTTAAIGVEPVAEEPTAEISGDVFYTTANVRMRSGPASSFNIVWTAPAGTKVHSVQVDGNWHLVKADEYEGWMYARYMREGSATQ